VDENASLDQKMALLMFLPDKIDSDFQLISLKVVSF
jgi:hypothetical protein